MPAASRVQDWEAAYRDRILPLFPDLRPAESSPRWVFVCGQQGSGKSTCCARLLSELGPDQTQIISSDQLTGAFPEFFARPDDPGVQADAATFRGEVRKAYVERLVQRATDMRSHLLWERPSTGDIEGLALIARSLGYQVECLILAVPIVESWLSTLRRSLARRSAGDPVVFDVSWTSIRENYRRWPALLARAEDNLTFDRITIVDRDGTSCFENRVQEDRHHRQWTAHPFAFESLVVERARPRTTAEADDLLADWTSLIAQPEIALRNSAVWPWEDIRQFGAILEQIRTDPATVFDLNAPAACNDAMSAPRWIGRLGAALDEILATPEAKGQTRLAARCQDLLALVSRIAGQPIR